MQATETSLPEGVRYGLLGRKLGHSWSPRIHAIFGSAPYGLLELEPDELVGFVRKGRWRGLNVTIPYKSAVLEAVDEMSPRVRALGAANTLVKHPDGTVFADNTDVYGFSFLLDRFCRERLDLPSARGLAGSEVLVLGSGGASKAVTMALADVGAIPVVVSRSGATTYENMLDTHAGAVLVVNATPVGMYPDCPASPLEPSALQGLTGLRGVIDVIYNPARTGICLQAQGLGLPFESGLAMLVAQALRSSELFQDTTLDDALIAHVERELASETMNIALIGMPGAGKSSAGRQLARLLGRPFVDLDDAFEMRYDMSAASCIERFGEEEFRARETATLAEFAARSGIVIACGGGIVTRERNHELLRQNSVVVMLDRPLAELSSAGRPLSQSKGVEQIAHERMHLYRGWADHVVACTGSAVGDAVAIRELLGVS